MARKKIIAGNWKMNMTPSEAVELVNTLKPLVANDDVDVVFCVPAIDIIPVVEAAKLFDCLYFFISERIFPSTTSFTGFNCIPSFIPITTSDMSYLRLADRQSFS